MACDYSQPDGLASRDGVLAIGMRLQSVASPALGPEPIAVTALPYEEIIATMKSAGRPITLTFRIPPRAAPRSLKLSRAEMQAKAQKASAVAQRTFGAVTTHAICRCL